MPTITKTEAAAKPTGKATGSFLAASQPARTTAQLKKESMPDWGLKFLAELQLRGTVTAACKAANVGRRTVYDERARNPLFATMMGETVEHCVEAVETTLYERALAGGTTEMIFFLKCRKPEVYGDKLRVEQIEQIRLEARREIIAEMQRGVSALAPAARELLMAAIPTGEMAALTELRRASHRT